MIKYQAERGVKPNVETKIFNSVEELVNSRFDYDYYHKIDILETHVSERHKNELKGLK